MNPEPVSVQQAIENARQAMQRGNRKDARRWAEKAAALAPDLEEPWLILAAVASPRASVAYLERVLEINPDSEGARKGLGWAVGRLRQAEGERDATARIPQHEEDLADTTPRRSQRSTSRRNSIPPDRSHSRSGGYRGVTFWIGLLLLTCLLAAWVFWPGNAAAAVAMLRGNNGQVQPTATLPGAAANITKPTYTPTPTATFTPTPTFTPSPTPTNTPTPTPTFTPSRTPLPTNTPDRQQSGPVPGYSPTGAERWIDLDLSAQRLYAYEGNTVVASFIVSTGTSQTPTVTGQYYVYIKLLYTDMAGPGYYLPDVPYTMYFYKGYGIHGTYWHSNFGVPMSHGCVNMRTSEAAWLFNWASVGTLVNIHY